MVQEIGTVGLHALRCFNTVARVGGISAAATRLGMAKSGVSRHVAQLESHLGVKLLERGGRSVKLTPVGEQLNLRIQSILAEIDLLDDIAREESVGVSGQVTIAATPEFGGLVAKTLFPIVQTQHPDLKLVMRTGYAFEDMQDPGTDLAFRVGTFQDDRLVAKDLGAFHAWLVAAPSVLGAHPINAPADLAQAPCLLFRGDRPTTTWTLQSETDSAAVDVTGKVGVQNFTVLLDLALASQGIAFLPDFMVRDHIDTGALVRCLPGHTSRPYNVFLAYRPGARRVARLNTVISLAQAHVPQLLSR